MGFVLAGLAVVDGEGVLEALFQLHRSTILKYQKTLVSDSCPFIRHQFINVFPRDLLQIRGSRLQGHWNCHPEERAE